MAMKLLVTFLLLPMLSYAKQIRVVVMDSGYYVNARTFKSCDNGIYDRNITQDKTMEDNTPHGQNIVHIIAKDLEKVDYCVIFIKIFSEEFPFDYAKYKQMLVYIKDLNPDIINMSIQGTHVDVIEIIAMNELLKQGINIVASAGNFGKNLDKNCNIYPACVDRRIQVVGSINPKGKRSKFSNYGKYVKFWEMGEYINAGGITQKGTSQAAALRTNRLIKELNNKNKN